jgi:hypothetical protein
MPQKSNGGLKRSGLCDFVQAASLLAIHRRTTVYERVPEASSCHPAQGRRTVARDQVGQFRHEVIVGAQRASRPGSVNRETKMPKSELTP